MLAIKLFLINNYLSLSKISGGISIFASDAISIRTTHAMGTKRMEDQNVLTPEMCWYSWSVTYLSETQPSILDQFEESQRVHTDAKCQTINEMMSWMAGSMCDPSWDMRYPCSLPALAIFWRTITETKLNSPNATATKNSRPPLQIHNEKAVSYTHLTLPTNREV